MNPKWTTSDMPSQDGKTALVTGANSGIGYETTKALAEKGATVIMACRNLNKANAAASAIRSDNSDAKLEIIQLDLADLASIEQCASEFKTKYTALDLLVNNGGVMFPPYSTTKDGFELQFGANHLGHFALTAYLLDRILAAPESRVVNVSSSTHRLGSKTIDFDNLNAEKGYKPLTAYAQSKLANLLFSLELTRHFKQINTPAIAASSDPGWTLTELQKGFLFHGVSRIIGQSPAMGALPSLYAATDPSVQPNDFYTPSRLFGYRGYPKKSQPAAAALDPDLAIQLWQISEQMCGVRYNWPRQNVGTTSP